MSGTSLSLLTGNIGIPTGLAGWSVLQKKAITSFKQFTSDPILKSQIAYFQANIGKATTADKFLADPRLQDVALTAFGLTAQIGATGLLKKVLNSNLADTSSVANQFTSTGYKKLAAALGYANASTPAKAAVASTATVDLDNFTGDNNFATFTGTFAGVTVKNVDLSGATTRDQIAATLNKAFQNADGGRTDISVKLSGLGLSFSDDLGRGTAKSFSWTAGADEDDPPSFTSPYNTRAGSQAVAATGGPNVTSASVVSAIISQYTTAKFDEVVGNSSTTLQNALYAKQNLPAVTSWYQVEADSKLAKVIQTALGLPSSFSQLDVDQQKAIYTSKMNIKDLTDPTKLGKLLQKYVAIGSAAENTAYSPAVQLLQANSGDSYANGSAIALLLST